MTAPATPPTAAPMIAPRAVDPVWLPTTAPMAPPAPAPMIAPVSFLFSDAQAMRPTPTETSARCEARGKARERVFDSERDLRVILILWKRTWGVRVAPRLE